MPFYIPTSPQERNRFLALTPDNETLFIDGVAEGGTASLSLVEMGFEFLGGPPTINTAQGLVVSPDGTFLALVTSGSEEEFRGVFIFDLPIGEGEPAFVPTGSLYAVAIGTPPAPSPTSEFAPQTIIFLINQP